MENVQLVIVEDAHRAPHHNLLYCGVGNVVRAQRSGVNALSAVRVIVVNVNRTPVFISQTEGYVNHVPVIACPV